MKIVPTKKQKIISSPSTSVEGSEEESIKVNIITKPVDDSEDNNNWKKVSCQLIPSKSTQAKAYYVCHIEDFDKAGTDKVKVGICVENSFNNKDFDIEYFMDDRKVFNIHRQGTIGSFRINKGENYFTKVVNYVTQTQNPFILEKNIIAEDVDDISESEVLEKIGKIKVITKSGQRMFVECIYAGASENSVNFENIKIKESQSKYKPLSVNLGGSVLVNYKPQITTLVKPQVYKEFEFEYYTKLGYLTKLRQYGLNIENILPYNPEVTNDEPEVIVIEDDEKEDALGSLDFILREKLKDMFGIAIRYQNGLMT
ncbi:hypothetical protein ABK040_013752 [Willaertia magna]